jgi:hypothetical protein
MRRKFKEFTGNDFGGMMASIIGEKKPVPLCQYGKNLSFPSALASKTKRATGTAES